MKKIGLLMVMMVVAGFVAVVQAGDYVAMVMDVDDHGVQFTDGEPVQVMAFLEANDVVQIQENAKISIMFFESSMREEIFGPAMITIGVNGSVSSAGRETRILRQTVDYLPPKARVDQAHYQNFGNIAFRKLGKAATDETQLVVTSTSNTVYPPDTRPMLTWKVYPHAEVFVLTVRGDHGADLSATKSCRILMPRDVQAPGRYTWVLEAKLDNRVVASRDGWYEIMDHETYKEMQNSREIIRDEYPAGGIQETAALALLYQSYEMWDETAALLLSLHKKQPDNTEVIRKIRSINPYLLEQ
jgi:hypothetical protein